MSWPFAVFAACGILGMCGFACFAFWLMMRDPPRDNPPPEIQSWRVAQSLTRRRKTTKEQR